ncbi:MAG: acylneuraminate cytidylyltransferase family protein [Syntrophomonas sp.]
MIDGKSVLAIIPARGGSKGIPHKNIRNLAGKPLIAWTIEEAKKSRCIDRLILSSDDEEIIRVAKEWGCEVPFIRPAELAQDDTPGIDPVIHAINTLDEIYDYAVLLQPTSPLRIVDDIDNCIRQCLRLGAPACVSVTEAQQNPYWMYKLDKDMRMSPVINQSSEINRRQDLPRFYVLNGAVYVAEVNYLTEHKSFLTTATLAFPMPAIRSIDIDTELDFSICSYLAMEYIPRA